VYSTIICVNCRQLIAVVFLCIKYFKYFVKIFNVKMVVDIIKLYKLSICRMALNCK
jgi:hypothetical protein